MSKKIIEVSGLQKSYKANHVLKDVRQLLSKSFLHYCNQTVVVLLLTDLITTNGDNVRECISLTGQFVAVDDVLTGRENLTLIGQLKRLPNLKTNVNEWLSFSRLEDAANRKVSTYSGGMRRRLDIAMSLMGNPDVLFLDEPTTGLDPQNRIAMWDLVKDLAKKGTTVFLTTQYLEEAEYLADNIAILHDGKIIAEGTPKYLKEIMPERGVRLNFDSELKADRAIKLLNENGISVNSIEQNLPSLEAVFLTLIDERKESDQHEKF